MTHSLEAKTPALNPKTRFTGGESPCTGGKDPFTFESSKYSTVQYSTVPRKYNFFKGTFDFAATAWAAFRSEGCIPR